MMADGSAQALSVLARSRTRIAERVIGREKELELTFATVSAGRDLLLEGPPGTSKTTILKAITAEWGIPLFLVEGNADLSPAKLLGHHSPARVLREDYSVDNFVPGPLLEAMQQGGFLYIEELNRAPEDTLNTLLMAMGDRSISVPRVGQVDALPSFRVLASMNPFDNVGTARLSASIHDRLNRVVIGYQSSHQEQQIVALRSGIEKESRIVSDAVALTRATRVHQDLRAGASVRGAIDLAMIAAQLIQLRGLASVEVEEYSELFYQAMTVALSGRIQVDEAVETTPELVLREIWEDHFILEPSTAAPG